MEKLSTKRIEGVEIVVLQAPSLHNSVRGIVKKETDNNFVIETKDFGEFIIEKSQGLKILTL